MKGYKYEGDEGTLESSHKGREKQMISTDFYIKEHFSLNMQQVKSVSSSFEEFFGYSSNELRGKSILRLLSLTGMADPQLETRALLAKGSLISLGLFGVFRCFQHLLAPVKGPKCARVFCLLLFQLFKANLRRSTTTWLPRAYGLVRASKFLFDGRLGNLWMPRW